MAILIGWLIFSVLCLVLPLSKYSMMGLLSMLFFIVLSAIVYYLGENATKSTRSGAFLSVIVINTFMKLIASFIFVFVYVKLCEPDDKLFIIPFFIFYLTFMFAETYFLSEQARSSKVK